jgi:hypothetical protein
MKERRVIAWVFLFKIGEAKRNATNKMLTRCFLSFGKQLELENP